MNERFALGVAIVSAAGVLAALVVVEGLRGDSAPLLIAGSVLGGVALLGLVVLGRIVVVSERTRARR